MREHSGLATESTESLATKSLTRTPTAPSPPSFWSPDICPMMVRMSLIPLKMSSYWFCWHAFFPHTSTQGLARAGQRLICASVVLHPTCHLNMRPFSTQASSPMVAAHPFLLLTHTQSADGLSSVGLHH